MVVEKSKFEEWWDEHPIFTRVYVPILVTLTLFVALINALSTGRG
jgi:hypothetical protein